VRENPAGRFPNSREISYIYREDITEEAIMELEYTYWKSGDGW
jgi:hypothetical protein